MTQEDQDKIHSNNLVEPYHPYFIYPARSGNRGASPSIEDRLAERIWNGLADRGLVSREIADKDKVKVINLAQELLVEVQPAILEEQIDDFRLIG